VLEKHGELWNEFSPEEALDDSKESQTFDYEIWCGFRTTPHERPTDNFSSRSNAERVKHSMVGGMVRSGTPWEVEGSKPGLGPDVLPG